MLREGAGRQHIDRDAQQLFEFIPNGTNVHHRGLFGGLHQQVEVTALGVITEPNTRTLVTR